MLTAKIRQIFSSLQVSKSFSGYQNYIPKLKTVGLLGARSFCTKNLHLVQMRGLDADTKEQDIIDFFRNLGIKPKTVNLKFDGSGRVAGMCEVEFSTHAEAVVAMRKKNAFLGNRFVRLTLRSTDINLTAQAEETTSKTQKGTYIAKKHPAELNIAENISSSLYHTGHVIKMKNAPKRITDQAIYEFFWPVGAYPISVNAEYNENGLRTGVFDIQFLTKNDAARAMVKNNAFLLSKNVELYPARQ